MLHDLAPGLCNQCLDVRSKAGVLNELPGESGAVAWKLPLPGVASCRYGACWMGTYDLPLLGWHRTTSQTVPAKQYASVLLSMSSVAMPSCP